MLLLIFPISESWCCAAWHYSNIGYCAIIRSVLEYACAVWHSGLTSAQSNDIERVQKRCLRIIFPELSYSDALFVAGLDRLSVRREQIVRDTFKNMQLPSHILHNLLPSKHDHQFNSRDKYSYLLPVARTQRYANSFIPYCIRKRYWYVWYGYLLILIFWLLWWLLLFSGCTNLELCRLHDWPVVCVVI